MNEQNKKHIDSLNLKKGIAWKMQWKLIDQSLERCANKAVIVGSTLVGNHCFFNYINIFYLFQEFLLSLKSIKSSEFWSDSEIQTLSFGGNSNFDTFLSPYLAHLGKTKNQINIFNLSAAEYYRKRLEGFATSGYFNEPPPGVEDGSTLAHLDSEIASG